jgi:hypothetical protein
MSKKFGVRVIYQKIRYVEQECYFIGISEMYLSCTDFSMNIDNLENLTYLYNAYQTIFEEQTVVTKNV